MTDFPSPDDPLSLPDPLVDPLELPDVVLPEAPPGIEHDEIPAEPELVTEPGITDTGIEQPPTDQPDPQTDFDYEPATNTEPEPAVGSAADPSPHDRRSDGPTPPPGAGYGQFSTQPVRRLYRSSHDRKVGGVSAGIAEYFDLDPILVRLGTLAAMFSGVGILVYLAAWVIVPERPAGSLAQAPLRAPRQERTFAIAVGLVLLAILVGTTTNSWEVFALASIAGGIWLLSERPVTSSESDHYATVPPTETYAAAPSQAATAYARGTFPNGPYNEPAPRVQADPYPPARVRKKQRITWIVLSLLALLAAVGIAAGTGDWWDVSAVYFLGIAIVVIGSGVVVGQLNGGGARGLIPLGILCALAMFPVSAIDGHLSDGFGEVSYAPATVEQVESSYRHGIGKLTVDLSALDFSDQSIDVDIDLGIGEVIVIVPNDVGGQAMIHASAGEIEHQLGTSQLSRTQDGINVETGTIRFDGPNGSVDLDIDIGFGHAVLRNG